MVAGSERGGECEGAVVDSVPCAVLFALREEGGDQGAGGGEEDGGSEEFVLLENVRPGCGGVGKKGGCWSSANE